MLLAIFMVSFSSYLIAEQFMDSVTDDYFAVRSAADGMRAREVAMAGFRAALGAVQTIPEEYLYTQGFIGKAPELKLAEECQDEKKENCLIYFVSFRILPEDGKINLNNLVAYNDESNLIQKGIVARLFSSFQIPQGNLENLVDWIDANDISSGGAEASAYRALRPPREIKNFRLFSLSELCLVKDFNREIVYESRAPEGWVENYHAASFQSEDEKYALAPEDWILSNNVTAYVPASESIDDKININGARYYTLLSLSEHMNDSAVRALLKLRRKSQGYIKSLSELRSLPEFQSSVGDRLTLYDELAGSGGDISGLVRTEGQYYRVVGLGTVIRRVDNNVDEQDVQAVRRVWGIWDRQGRQLIYYAED
ncbi:MAG: general secretion pathway protein GspK [Leptospirales bacterium]|nr:general secretion pathway protein GspK [Leptospirales bacterium]